MEYTTFQLPFPYWKQTCKLRLDVFVDEQGVPEALEIDEFDAEALHFIALENDKVIGTLRLLFKNDTVKLGRLAIVKSKRHQGIATQLMKEATHHCQQKAVNQIKLDAQITVKGFYHKLGYVVQGKEFMDAGIPHVLMIKSIHLEDTTPITV